MPIAVLLEINTCLIILMVSLIFLIEKKPGRSLGKRERTFASEGGSPGSPGMDLLMIHFLYVRLIPRDLLSGNAEGSFLLSGVQLA